MNRWLASVLILVSCWPGGKKGARILPVHPSTDAAKRRMGKFPGY